MTVDINGTAPPFSSFYGEIASALKLQFGSKGSFCSWTQLQPSVNLLDENPFNQHGSLSPGR